MQEKQILKGQTLGVDIHDPGNQCGHEEHRAQRDRRNCAANILTGTRVFQTKILLNLTPGYTACNMEDSLETSVLVGGLELNSRRIHMSFRVPKCPDTKSCSFRHRVGSLGSVGWTLPIRSIRLILAGRYGAGAKSF